MAASEQHILIKQMAKQSMWGLLLPQNYWILPVACWLQYVKLWLETTLKTVMTFKAIALHLTLTGASALLLMSNAFAQTDAGKDALYVKSLAATCANCHGTNGKATEGSAVVSLAGLDKAYHVAQLKAFKSGTRPATVMHQLSKGYSDVQIEVLATYFAAQKK